MIQIDSYIKRIDSIASQYDFARKAILGYLKQSNPSATVQIADLENLLPDGMTEYSASEFRQRLDKYIASLKHVFPEKHQDLANRLSQNEIILLVAVFEDFMKLIHSEVLRHNLGLLNSERTIPLGRLTALGEAKIIEEEIERAVQMLDRKSAREKCQAFAKLGLSWDEMAEKIDAVIRLRNEILHEDVNRLVTGQNIQDCRMCVLELPMRVCSAGMKAYPATFEETRILQIFDAIIHGSGNETQ